MLGEREKTALGLTTNQPGLPVLIKRNYKSQTSGGNYGIIRLLLAGRTRLFGRGWFWIGVGTTPVQVSNRIPDWSSPIAQSVDYFKDDRGKVYDRWSAFQRTTR